MFIKLGEKVFQTKHISAVRPSGAVGWSIIRLTNGYEYSVNFEVDDVLHKITNGDMA